MADVEVNVKGAEEDVNAPLEDEVVEGAEIEPETPDEEEEPVDHSEALRGAKLAVLVEHYLPDSTDIETELNHVGGLEVDAEGNISGEGVYRPPSLPEQKRKKKQITKPRNPVNQPQEESWETRREKIRQQKLAAGLIHN